jgi:hypothetical protein
MEKFAKRSQMATIDNTMPSKVFLNVISNSELMCKASSIITQICIGHLPLNKYLYNLYRFKRVNNPRCPTCGAVAEMVNHFLFTCCSYVNMRWPLEHKCKGALMLKKILMNLKLVTSLIRYIDETKRFKQQ